MIFLSFNRLYGGLWLLFISQKIRSSSAIVAVTNLASMRGLNVKSSRVADYTYMGKSLFDCVDICGNRDECLLLQYNGESRSCELLTAEITSTSVSQGWILYMKITDPCSSSPCSSPSICTPYPIPQLYPDSPNRSPDYDHPRYVCLSNSWILEKYNAGKTKCSFSTITGRNFYGSDLYSARMNYWDAIQKCAEYEECRSVQCRFYPTEMEYCYIKKISAATGHTTTIPGNYISFYYDCE